jgi:hypothetical protein
MPYIPKLARKIIDEIVNDAHFSVAANGSLNYFLVKLMLVRRKLEGESYTFYKNYLGELEAAKLEIYRRYVAPYEDKKMKENGDVKE